MAEGRAWRGWGGGVLGWAKRKKMYLKVCFICTWLMFEAGALERSWSVCFVIFVELGERNLVQCHRNQCY